MNFLNNKLAGFTAFLAGFCITLFIFLQIDAREQDALQIKLQNMADIRIQSFNTELKDLWQSTHALEALIHASNNVTPSEFKAFTDVVLDGLPEIESIMWWSLDTQSTDSALSPIYQPTLQTQKVSNPVELNRYKEVFAKIVKDSTIPHSIIPSLEHDTEGAFFALTLPVYQVFTPNMSKPQLKQPMGFVVAKINVSMFIEQALNRFVSGAAKGLDISIYENNPENRGQLLHFHPSRIFTADRNDNLTLSEKSSYGIESDFTIGSINWRVTFTPVNSLLIGLSNFSKTILIAGLIISGFLAFLIQTLIRRKETIEQQVETRTQELNEFKNTLNQTLDCVFMFDAETLLFFYVNQGALNQVGYSYNELMQMTAVDIKPNMDKFQLLELIKPLQNGSEESLMFETIHRHKDGHDIPVEISLQCLTRNDTSQYFIAIVRDITDRKQAEQELLDRETRISAILDNAVDGIITIDERGLVETYNRSAEKLFGYESNEVIGHNIKMLMPNHYASEHDGYLANYRETGHAKIINIGREVEGQHKNGTIFPLELAVAEVYLGKRRIFTGIVRDITERKKAEKDLIQAKDRAEKANKAKSDFLSRMSHELRTPLNAIVGFAQLIELTSKDSEERESIEHILKAGRHLTQLINEVLDIARIESGHQNISLESVHVRSTLDDTWNLVQPLAAKRNIQLNHTLPEECDAYVTADIQRLKQILLNLLSNAIKYNYDGGMITLSCSLSCEGIIRICISDTGPGIEPCYFEKVFEPFERLNATQTNIEGSGVGLALSKALAQAMGGKIGLDSKIGEGSTFWVELPLVDKPVQHFETIEENHEVAEKPNLEQTHPPATILYIEDNVANLRLVEVALSHLPHVKLISALNGQLGVELATSHKPNLILLDLHLPGLMGDEVLARLKSNPETQHIPIIMLSADATQRQIEKLLNSGAYAYLTKPFNIKELLHTIGSALEGNTTE